MGGFQMVKFDTVDAMVAAWKRDEFPAHVISPGDAAAALGITRPSLHGLLNRGTLPAWTAPGVILVDANAVNLRVKAKAQAARDANVLQGELL